MCHLPPPPTICLLEGLTVEPHVDKCEDAITHLNKNISKDSSLMTNSIINALFHNLKSISIDMKVVERVESSGYIMLTASTLIEFMKQPQFVLLNVDDPPVEECYDLVEAFLCNQATHGQKLCVRMINLRDKYDSNPHENEGFHHVLKIKRSWPTLHDPPVRSQLKQLLPSSNAQFKSLYVSQYNNKRFSKWLMQFSELKLKKLVSWLNIFLVSSKF